VPGLAAPVKIARDARGIPHIEASCEPDAFFAQGFCHGQDRLWQMELSRRSARGGLSEVFGREALDLDVLLRRLGLHRAAATEWHEAPAEVKEVLESYSAGVNACITATPRRRLPLEFHLARFKPRMWEPLDSLATGRLMAFLLSPNWGTELIRSRLVQEIGFEAARLLEEEVWGAGARGIPGVTEDAAPGVGEGRPPGPGKASPPAPVELPGGMPGSNSFVVAGSRTVSGLPLLGNDVHLFPQMPSVMYEAHLKGSELDVAGATVPGLPGVVIGHNRRIAWGVTSSMVDVADLFVERPDPTGLPRTAYEGGWSDGRLVSERIDVKGRAEPHTEEVLETERHGPLLTPTGAFPTEERPLALRSMVLEPCQTLGPLLAVNRASNWVEFRGALEAWVTPSFNFVYSDVEGNIGYQMAGRVPRRRAGAGLVPSPGWEANFEWAGVLFFDELPSGLNPPDGMWATANDDVTAGTNAFFSQEFCPPVRFRRIRDLLERKERHSREDLALVQGDRYSAPLVALAAALLAHVEPASDLERAVLARLTSWDGHMSEDSPEASVCEVVRTNLVTATAGAPGNLRPLLLGSGPHPVLSPISSLYFLQGARVTAWLQSLERNNSSEESRPTLQAAFADAVDGLRYSFGDDIGSWGWGRLHTLTMRHALSLRPPLGALFDVGPFPCGGNIDSINVTGPLPGGDLRAGGPIAAYRIVADTSDWDTTMSCIPGGQSGHRASPHYADQLDDWRACRYHRLPFTRAAVAADTRHIIRLMPEAPP
jgi:penicillin G amidase